MTGGSELPAVEDPDLVGSYTGHAYAGGGYVWDAVLEYRVWCHPERGAPDEDDGSDYFRAFGSYEEALAFSEATPGAEEPLALVRQDEHIDEPEPGVYRHVKESRMAEWPVEFLRRPRRTPDTIPDFLAPDAPANRLDIIRGLAPDPREMFRELPWPFPDDEFPQRLGASIMVSVLDGHRPALQVVHFPDDNSWGIADGVGDPNEEGAATAAHIWHVLSKDDSLLELATLPPGYVADRESPEDPWVISEFEWEPDEEDE